MTTNWFISNLERNTADGLVTVIHWTASTADGDFSAAINNTQQLERGESFVDYATLTEATVLEWLWGKVDKEVVEAALEAQIEAQRTPVKASGLPWGQA
jgi:diphthamide synthase (EF-2-diphthine--ammonia ligase)